MTKFNKGDKVTIIPCDEHEAHVKEHYGKILEIKDIIEDDTPFYKVRGVKNYANESDLQLA